MMELNEKRDKTQMQIVNVFNIVIGLELEFHLDNVSNKSFALDVNTFFFPAMLAQVNEVKLQF